MNVLLLVQLGAGIVQLEMARVERAKKNAGDATTCCPLAPRTPSGPPRTITAMVCPEGHATRGTTLICNVWALNWTIASPIGAPAVRSRTTIVFGAKVPLSSGPENVATAC